MRRILGTNVAVAPTVDLLSNPYNKTGAHHRPMGTGATYAGSSHPAVQDFLQSNFTALNTGLPYGIYLITNNASMPLRTVTAHSGGGSNIPVTLRMPVITTPGPVNGNYPDANVCIFNTVPDAGLEVNMMYHFYEFSWPTGQTSPTAHVCYLESLTTPGNGPPREGSSASGVASLFGVMHGFEINANDAEITHAIRFSGHAQPGGSPMTMKNDYQWPSIGTDGFCKNSTTNCQGEVPYGSLWALPQSIYTDAYIDGMNLTTLGRRIARQMRNYGGYFTDDGNGRASRCDQTITQAKKTEFVAQMQIIYPNLRMVLNNTQDQTCSGGGTPLAPNTAFDA